MTINEIDYYFKVREDKDVALNLGVIYKNLGYSKIDKTKISKIYNITNEDIDGEYYLNNITIKVKSANERECDKLNNICEQLKCKWEAYKGEYFDVINKVFGIELDYSATNYTYCYLQLLPINELDLVDHIIYLDANRRVEDIFKTFIIMLTKALLLDRWNDVNDWEYNCEFEGKNKVWMFVEIAIDAIFNNSDLIKISNQPSYEFFYNLKFKDKNVMEEFRNLYKTSLLDKFFTDVYMFVHENYQTLLRFKNYLY